MGIMWFMRDFSQMDNLKMVSKFGGGQVQRLREIKNVFLNLK